MLIESSLFAIFLVGLLGGTHCVGMCGGIVAAISMQLPSGGARFPYHAAYNLGRISSYVIAGALMGAVGSSTLLLNGFLPVEQMLYVLANVMLLLLGLYLAGITHAVVYIERLGGALWKCLKPYMARLLPIKKVSGAFMIGLVWGWLPCGLVYSVLLSALASGDALHGALLMLAFGLGTLPNLFAMGLFAQKLKPWLQQKAVRLGAGLLVAGLGAWGLLNVVNMRVTGG